MKLEEIQTKLDRQKKILEIKYQAAAAMRKALELAGDQLEELEEDFDEDEIENEILALVTDEP